MEEALMSYDGCSGLVGDFYGEFSKDVDRLIKLAAQEGAELHAAKYGLESVRRQTAPRTRARAPQHMRHAGH